ncbi:potassium-transporting ATPase subunit C [Luoshenia tenuis]|uniref:potassium-transporting ATPase subunit C n=1 Tax=Luoshenia tenuis TaxID=2763654 RepID=UPI003D94E32F
MLICGLIFPTLLTGLSALIFPHQAGDSLVEVEGQTLGAQNVGQEFTQDYYSGAGPRRIITTFIPRMHRATNTIPMVRSLPV